MFEDIFQNETLADIQEDLISLAKQIAKSRTSIIGHIKTVDNLAEILVEADMLLKKYEALHSDAENLEIQDPATLETLGEDIKELKVDRDEMRRHAKECKVVDKFLDECLVSKDGSLHSRLKEMKRILLAYQGKHSEAKNTELMAACEKDYAEHVKKRFDLKNIEIKVTKVTS